jgi:hypothetical protein
LRLDPYPARYRPALACSLFLYPLPHGSPLRETVPCGRATGLPRSADVSGWGRSQLSAGGPPSAPQEFGVCGPDHLPVWPRRVSILRLSSLTTFSAASRKLTCPPNPGSRPPRCWQSQPWLAPTLPPLRVRLRYSGSFGPLRCQRRTSRSDIAGRTASAVILFLRLRHSYISDFVSHPNL